jgi:hypothetical protein
MALCREEAAATSALLAWFVGERRRNHGADALLGVGYRAASGPPFRAVKPEEGS